MNVLGIPPPSSSAPQGGAPEDELQKPKDRRWFIVLAWVTLILFGIFVAGITLSAVFIPELREAQEGTAR